MNDRVREAFTRWRRMRGNLIGGAADAWYAGGYYIGFKGEAWGPRDDQFLSDKHKEMWLMGKEDGTADGEEWLNGR